MSTTSEITKKRIYIIPQIEKVKLDSDISLALESSPPVGPNELTSLAPEYFNNNPLKTFVG